MLIIAYCVFQGEHCSRDDEPMVKLKTKVTSSLSSLLTRLARQATVEVTKNDKENTSKESCDMETVDIGTNCKNNGCGAVSCCQAYVYIN